MASSTYQDFLGAVSQGTGKRLTFMVTKLGAPQDITGWRLQFRAHANSPDAAPLFTLDSQGGAIAIVGDASGIATGVITPDLLAALAAPAVLYCLLIGTDGTGLAHELAAGRILTKPGL